MEQLQTILTTDLSKKEAIAYGKEIAVELVEEGRTDLLKQLLSIKKLEAFLEGYNSAIKKPALEEAMKQGGRSFKQFGAEFQIKENGTKWHFDKCQSPKHAELTAKLKGVQEELKAHEDFLKSLKEQHTYVDEESGEAITVFPPYKTSETGMSIIF